MKNQYSGVFPAFYACYDDAGSISPARTQGLARHLLTSGVQGLYVGGSSGECIYLSVDERKMVLENVMDAVGGKMRVIAHVACNNTKDSIALARHAERLKVDAIAAIPPIYFRLPEYAIRKYWNDISDAAPDTDFIIYNIPQLAGVALTRTLYREMLKNERVCGVKNSSMPVQDIRIFKDMGGDRVSVLNGPDEQFVAGLMMGADGGIGGTYAVMPALFLKAYALVRSGKNQEAALLQSEICRIIDALCSCKGSMYAVIKELLRRKNVPAGSVRAPLFPLQPEDLPQVDACERMIRHARERFL